VNTYDIKNPTSPNTDVEAPIAKLLGLKQQERSMPPIPVTKYRNIILHSPIPNSIPFPKNS